MTNLNEHEKNLLDLIEAGPVTSHEIADRLWGKRKPWNARQRVNDQLVRLRDKLDENKDPRKLVSSGRMGPKPASWSLEARA